MKKHFLIFLMLAWAAFSGVPAFSQDESFAADTKAAGQLQKALKTNDRLAVARLITYPLTRDAPLKPIANAKEFLAHWDEYFDAAATAELVAAQPEQYGWRGIALANGTVWFGKGHIVTINTETAAAKKTLQDAKTGEASRLYPSLRGYDSIAFECSSKAMHIRVQKTGEELHYFAWKKGAALSSKPELELAGGVYDPQGTGGNFNLTFQNNGYTYELEVGHNLCGEDCNDYLTVTQSDKSVSHDICTEIKN